MGLHTQEERGRFLTVVAGMLREKTEEGVEGAVKRSGTVSNGKSYEKWEFVYPGITAFITKVELQDGKFGKNVLVHLTDKNEESFIVSLVAENSRTGVPFMEALPNLDLKKEVTFKPYKFDNDKGENVEGMKITQDGEKIYSAFYDKENKKRLLGMPEPEANKKGEVNWKLYFAQRDEWLQNYLLENGYMTEAVYEPSTNESPEVSEDDDSF